MSQSEIDKSRRKIDKETGLELVMIRGRPTEEKGCDWGNVGLSSLALVALWTYYAFFGWFWLYLFTELGDNLLWTYFGVFVVVTIGTVWGVAKSMQAQRLGWWERSKDQRRDERGTFCGCDCY